MRLQTAPFRDRLAERHAMAVRHAVQRGRTARKAGRREMPKLKTKSGVKKRFKLTATGKLKAGVAGKRHRLISHNAKYIRQNRGTKVMSEADTKIVKLFTPYGLS
jgi:large subunit ribosomal protein L35